VKRAARDAFTLRWGLPAAILVLGSFVYLHALSAVEWKADELGYRNAGVAYLRGDFTLNAEHPFLVKYLLEQPST
jgi:hypothetical protein